MNINVTLVKDTAVSTKTNKPYNFLRPCDSSPSVVKASIGRIYLNDSSWLLLESHNQSLGDGKGGKT